MTKTKTPDEKEGGGAGLASGLAIGIGAVAAAVFAASRMRADRVEHPHDDAPAKSRRGARTGKFGDYTVVGKTVTINRPRQELFAYWRDFTNLSTFMENVEKVEVLDARRSRWTISAPAGRSVTFDTEIAKEEPGTLIAWASTDDAPVKNHGRVAFRDAPPGRGTLVEATIAYVPPGGELGRWFAKLFQAEPQIQARRELKRFKQLMETGEIATTEPGPAAPRGA